MSYRIGLLLATVGFVASPALADTGATKNDRTPPQQQAAPPAVKLAVPPPDFTPPRRDLLSPIDDIPSSGSSSQYVHGPNEGPVPGASQYRLGGPPPNAEGLLGGN